MGSCPEDYVTHPERGVVRSFFMSKEKGSISSWTALGLIGVKVKFQVSSTFCFQLVKGLCSCGQQFSSEEGVRFL